jgi:DNA-binding winged helix-turn-helix (wHTH) protein
VWRFGPAEFDEALWRVTVNGQPVVLEGKPLEVLHELLLNADRIVTKDELMNAVWPGVSVVEGSLPTAVSKLRRALEVGPEAQPLIETAPRLGYRMAAPVTVLQRDETTNASSTAVSERPAAPRAARRAMMGVAAALGLGLALFLAAPRLSVMLAPQAAAQEARDAFRTLDIPRIQTLIRSGWNPDAAMDDQNNNALGILMGVCEWDRGHDQRRLMLLARILYDSGARVDHRNTWGDTPYSIAAAPRYCGPHHPVTVMLHTACYNGYRPLGDACEARYSTSRR